MTASFEENEGGRGVWVNWGCFGIAPLGNCIGIQPRVHKRVTEKLWVEREGIFNGFS